MRSGLVGAVVALMLGAGLIAPASAQSFAWGRVTVVFAPEAEREMEALAGVEKALLAAGVRDLLTFPNRPMTAAELAERELLDAVDTVIEIYSARVVSTDAHGEGGYASVSARVFLGIRVLRVISGQALQIVGFLDAEGSATLVEIRFFGQPNIDQSAVVMAAYRNAAAKIISFIVLRCCSGQS